MVQRAGNVIVSPRMGLRYVNVMPGILTMEIPVKVGFLDSAAYTLRFVVNDSYSGV